MVKVYKYANSDIFIRSDANDKQNKYVTANIKKSRN